MVKNIHITLDDDEFDQLNDERNGWSWKQWMLRYDLKHPNELPILEKKGRRR